MNMHVPAASTRLEALFAAQAAATPDALAVLHRGREVSYGDLDAWVDRLARELVRQGVRPGVLVALNLQRTPALVATLLAILRAGGAYLPLDARNPPERTRFMLDDSGCQVLVLDAAAAVPEGFAGRVLELSDGCLISRASGSPAEAALPADLAYVIYTSGSTGRPKGVMLGQGAVHLVQWARRAYAAEELARVAASTSLCFDPSVFELFVPLCTGGAVILRESALEPFADDERPTLMAAAPSVLRELCRAGALPSSLKVLISGGEALTGELAREALQLGSHVRVENHYGPTEATTCATVARLGRDFEGDPPIGTPVRGAVVVLERDGELWGRTSQSASGEVGEILIGGPGLALGYLDRPDLTAARFVNLPRGRFYRTGDLGVWRDGELHFAGRTDRQVKLRGFRIELGEVEASLMRAPSVEEAVVTLHDDGGRRELQAHVQSPEPLTEAALREMLAGWLPAYMVPARIVVSHALPRLVSGKVDRTALPEAPPSPVRPASNAVGLERPIVHVFQQMLRREGVGPCDSFFELGGDSLSSVQTALRLGELLGLEVPPALIHQAPTARLLAASLNHAQVQADSHLALLQPGGDEPPLYGVADIFGHAFNYLSLSRRLAADRPVFGLSPGPLQAAFVRDGDIGALTRGFLHELRATRPAGPYLIAGYSAGGLLAVELAAALEREGEVVRLVLLDSRLRARRRSAGAFDRWLTGRLPAVRKAGLARGRSGGLLEMIQARLSRTRTPGWIPRTQLAYAARMIQAAARHAPSTFSGRTLLVRAQQRKLIDRLTDADGGMGWTGVLTGDVERITVAGDHHQFLREPHVAATAQAVSRFLRG